MKTEHEIPQLILIERYKYIQAQKSILNQRAFDVLGLFQTLTTGIVGALLTVYLSWKALSVDVWSAKVSLMALIVLESLVAIYAIVALVSGIRAWRRYKKDEREISSKFELEEFESAPSIWIWHELYIILFVMLMYFVLMAFTLFHLIPSIK